MSGITIAIIVAVILAVFVIGVLIYSSDIYDIVSDIFDYLI